MKLLGKGYYMWQLARCDDADPARIRARALAADLSHVLIKIADGGGWEYNVDKERDVDLVPPVLRELRSAGIQVWGWQYVRGDAPYSEAQLAIKRISELRVDGFVIDAEHEYRDRSKAPAAARYMKELRKAFPELPIALSTYRYPRSHPALPYEEFLDACDFAMPQVYFEMAHNPVEQLQRSLDQYMSLPIARPIIPTAPTYRRGDWQPTPDEIHRFLDYSKQTGLQAANAWSWDFATREPYVELFQAVADFPWPTKPPIADMPERLIGRLNQHDPAHVAGLYLQDAAHVTGDRIVIGREPVQAWYQTLLKKIIPDGEFQLTGKIVDGSTRQFTWEAVNAAGRSVRGNDTLSVVDGRIRYHYTYLRLNEDK